ncbi:MAG: membrane protein insertase YidC [Treponema sp.]|uniref:membrane protein insertase YidC n=1 Tax=Treponema sp. TaxID=166 RepID=UPI0025ECF836|nr:membrane protein insertase YidC [Treponema sp.]MBR0494632.1 membrane protein insertase YidC [Treponema sp.]
MPSIFYNLIIFPISQLLEFFYQFIYEATNREPIAIIGLSFVVTLCTLPLYMVAEGWQEKERETRLKLQPGIDRIKKAFKSDEQYMILNTFYKQNHYSPIMALRSSLSLLIQIPFFLAAYHFLSEFGDLKGVSFLFIKDFGSPDATFHIGSFAVNILPIAMTIINCLSGFLYSKGHSFKEKLQIYIFAAVFLIILYNSPAGLVVYWTMNNILSLVKNIFYKLKNPKKILYIILCIFALFCICAPFTVLQAQKSSFKKAFICMGIILPLLPLGIIKAASFFDRHFKFLDTNKNFRCFAFFLSATALTILAGAAIPSIIIESEPNNYCYVDSYKSPFVFMISTFFQSAGVFLLWAGAFYGLFSARVKKILTIFFVFFAFAAVVNTFAFGGKYGPIDPWLEFMQPQVFMPSMPSILFNFLIIASLLALTICLILRFPAVLHSLLVILILSLTTISTKNIIKIQTEFSRMPVPSYNNDLEPIFHLSKTEPNVIVIMQDRCFSPFIPYVFEELPHLKAGMDGFTYYPNTISMGMLTMIGTPGLFGGYDYTPYRMNQRAIEEPEKTLQDKHSEAMLTLPLLFTANGFRAEVANLPYENYLEQPESNMYFKNPNFERQGIEVESREDLNDISYIVKYKGHEPIRHNKVLATYTNHWYAQHGMEKEPYISSQIFRNFIWFSLFKMASPVLRGAIYHRDYWMAYNKWDNSARFVDNYSVIDYLPELTKIDDDKGTIILLDNEATHEPTFLQAPEYEFRKTKDITNLGNSILKENPEFSTMCGIFNKYIDFFDYLKQNGVYDNTKIIIVSDHGMPDNSEAMKNFKTNAPLKSLYVATLIVKDFNSHGEIKTDYTYMTNADTPYLAAKDVIKDAKHPFTGKPLEVEDKNAYSILNNSRAQSTRIRKEKAFDVKPNEWYTVKDNIFIDENWSRLNK